jgi:subtilase family serine protease
MNKLIALAAATALAAAPAAVAASGPAARAGATRTAGFRGDGPRPVPDSAVPFATAAREAGAVPGFEPLTIQLWLTPRTAAAADYATEASTPGNPLYRHFLSPAGYTARFGASRAEAGGVQSWLRSAGFTGVSADAGRDYVQASAPVSTIDAAFGVRLQYYRAPARTSAGQYPLRANDRPFSLPASIADSVLGVTGLDNAAPVMTYTRPEGPGPGVAPRPAQPAAFPCSAYYGQHYTPRLPSMFGATSFPTEICGYSATQVRRAYGYSAGNAGKGVTVALVEVGLTPDMFLTLHDYTAASAIQAPSESRYAEVSLGRNPACGDPFNIEEQLDVEATYVMAPLAKELVVGGDSCDNGFYGLQALYDADIAVLNGTGGHPLASIASNSWEAQDETIPVNLLDIEHAYLVRAAAEGVSMLFSAGDTSGVLTPSSDPFATAVGGTTLGIGARVPRLFETGWSTGVDQDTNDQWAPGAEAGAGGGGPSLLWSQPAYQYGVVPSWLATAPGDRGGLVRTMPDISALADPCTGFGVGLLSFSAQGSPTGFAISDVGGTSLAAPLVAGLVADAEQGSAASFGLLNPALYLLAGTSAVNDALPLTSATPAGDRAVACDAATCGALTLNPFDVQSFGMLGYTGQVTSQGYDTMTGIGTPNGQHFITALRDLG